MADIFVSYTSSDRDWAQWIGQELETLGHAPHLHEWEIPAGGNIAAWMEQRHNNADHILCVVSKDYLTKDYSSWERQSAQWAAASKRPNFALPVFVEECEAPTLLGPFKRCDLFGLSEEDARARIETYLAPAAKPSGPARFPGADKSVQGKLARPETVAFPGRRAALSNIPIAVPLHFLGRDDALQAIDAALKRYEGRVAITALHGLRGVGKTTLAAAYAERHRGDYRATWWIRAQTSRRMRADLVSLGVRLGWVAADEKEEPALDKVRERLRDEGEGLLLIYDNAIDAASLKPYLPPGGAARVLVTSNAHAWRGVAAPVEIRLWPKEIGADYLIARTGRDDERAGAQALSEALGGLPLAHEQAAAYCERLDMSLAEYARRLETTPTKLLDAERDAPAEYHDRLTVAKTFALAIDEAAKLHPAAEPLIVHAALLAPEPIPLFLFSEGREKFGEPLASQLADDGLDEALAALRAFALIDRETIVDERDPAIATETIRLHRLVRTVAAGRLQGEAAEAARRVLIEAMAAVYPRDRSSMTRFLAARAAARRARSRWSAAMRSRRAARKGQRRSAGSAWLLPAWGARGLCAGAAALRARAGDPREGARPRASRYGGEPQQPRPSCFRTRATSRARGRFSSARWRSAKRRSAPSIPTPPRASTTSPSASGPGRLRRRAAAVRARAGDLREGARPRASDHRDEPQQPRPPASGAGRPRRRAAALSSARWRSARRCSAPTIPIPRRASTTSPSCFRPRATSRARGRSTSARWRSTRRRSAPTIRIPRPSLNNLACLLQAQGDLAAARPLFERALAINEKALGPEHPDTATSLNNLASLLQAQGDLAGARPLLERALAIREKALGPEHPDTAQSLNNLASCFRTRATSRARGRSTSERWRSTRRRSAPSIPTLRRTSTTSRLSASSLRATSPGRDLSTSARWRFARRRSAPSIPLPRRASTTSLSCFRPRATSPALGHCWSGRWRSTKRRSAPSTPRSRRTSTTSPTCFRPKATSRAHGRFHERALAIREKALGPEHPGTATSLNNLATLLLADGDLAGARPLFERALAINERRWGRSTLHGMNLSNLARVLRDLGEFRRPNACSSARPPLAIGRSDQGIR